MTIKLSKRMQRQPSSLQALVAIGFGAIEALLLARLVARLLAARVENTAIATLYALSDPLIWPLATLDGGQPRFGATLEFSTFILALCVPALAFSIWKLIARYVQTSR